MIAVIVALALKQKNWTTVSGARTPYRGGTRNFIWGYSPARGLETEVPQWSPGAKSP